jgi:hypothetical protein
MRFTLKRAQFVEGTLYGLAPAAADSPMRPNRFGPIWLAVVGCLFVWLGGCASAPVNTGPATGPSVETLPDRARATSVFGPRSDFVGSESPDVGLSGLFPVCPPDDCGVAGLAGGEDSLAVRLAALKNADTSIRSQALRRGDPDLEQSRDQ